MINKIDKLGEWKPKGGLRYVRDVVVSEKLPQVTPRSVIEDISCGKLFSRK